MAIPLPFAQGFYLDESLPLSAQECINLYPSVPETLTITKEALRATQGIQSATTVSNNFSCRGGQLWQDNPWLINGGEVFRITRTFDVNSNPVYTSTRQGGATPVSIPGTARVVTADNGPDGQLCIVVPESSDQFNAFLIQSGTDLIVQVSDSDFDGPVNSVKYVDGFFVFTKKDGSKFFISNLRDGFSYIATDFADAEVDPDPIKASFVLTNELFIYGSQTMEPFQNIGGSGFPFQRINGGVLEKGLDSIYSIIEMNGLMVWLGSSEKEKPAIWASDGGKPQKISSPAIDNQIRTYGQAAIENCFSWKYAESGELFVAFTFPGEECFVYNETNGRWHTRQSEIDEEIKECRVSVLIQAFGVFIVGDLFSNKVGVLDKDTFTEYGEIIRRRFVLPPLDNNGQPFFNDSIELFGESGVGLTNDEDPEVLMSYSDDGGRTFLYTAAPESFGKIGEYDERAIWTQLGRVSRERMYRFDMSDPVKWVVLKVEANIS